MVRPITRTGLKGGVAVAENAQRVNETTSRASQKTFASRGGSAGHGLRARSVGLPEDGQAGTDLLTDS